METEIKTSRSLQEYKDKCTELGKDANLKIIGGFGPYSEGGYESLLYENRETLEKILLQFTPE